MNENFWSEIFIYEASRRVILRKDTVIYVNTLTVTQNFHVFFYETKYLIFLQDIILEQNTRNESDRNNQRDFYIQLKYHVQLKLDFAILLLERSLRRESFYNGNLHTISKRTLVRGVIFYKICLN